ncbi:hypothetical protein GGS24DRAFT_437617 [Hypoxylon argillaceum]|nr:hypothetical protein GGS24DRAFT_437617 [Hypoxylon argillaceum]
MLMILVIAARWLLLAGLSIHSYFTKAALMRLYLTRLPWSASTSIFNKTTFTNYINQTLIRLLVRIESIDHS